MSIDAWHQLLENAGITSRDARTLLDALTLSRLAGQVGMTDEEFVEFVAELVTAGRQAIGGPVSLQNVLRAVGMTLSPTIKGFGDPLPTATRIALDRLVAAHRIRVVQRYGDAYEPVNILEIMAHTAAEGD